MQKVIYTGNSLAVTIPNNFAKVVGIKKGDSVRVEKRIDKGSLVFYFQGARQLVFSAKFKS